MSVLDLLDWAGVRRHYDDRVKTHRALLDLHSQNDKHKFAELALGVSNPTGNYSSVEHGLGPKILGTNPNAESRIFALASNLLLVGNARSVPEIVRLAKIKYLQIGVGSEISCMMNPQICWVANTRTIWTHLVVKHADNVAKADEELRLYRESSADSEMHYAIWAAIHAELDVALTRTAEQGAQLAKIAGVAPGDIIYLWADAIANGLYEKNHC